jgi:hypothetical protein
MIEVHIEQGSKDWLNLRLGRITGTRLKEVFKSDNLSLIDELIAEVEVGEVEESFTNSAMQRGKDLEPIAKSIYNQVKNIELEDVGFCINEKYKDNLGLSPDAFTKDRLGAVEIKCPNTKTHVKYIRMNVIPREYIYQVYMYFIVNEKLEWLDFVSFDDRFKIRPMFVKRVNREEIEEQIKETQDGLDKFLKKLDKYKQQIISM